MRCFELQLLPANNSHFYVTTNVVSEKHDLHLQTRTYMYLSSTCLQGCVLHGVRYGGKAPPAYHWASESKALERLTSVDFSPFSEHVFLVSLSANLLIAEVPVFVRFCRAAVRTAHSDCTTWRATSRSSRGRTRRAARASDACAGVAVGPPCSSCWTTPHSCTSGT